MRLVTAIFLAIVCYELASGYLVATSVADAFAGFHLEKITEALSQ